MAVSIKPGDAFEAGQPARLFSTTLAAPARGPTSFRYDVAADGQRFLLNLPVIAPAADTKAPEIPITAVINWIAALGKK